MPVYVQHETLGKVNDVFNAEAIWQPPGLALFARRPLLRDLLERSPREQRGHAATRCFSHVTLMLPQDEVDDDRHLTRGARVRDLAATLAALHQKDFGDLLGNDEVRYDVVGDDNLGPGEVEVKFGHAVYLPAPGEKLLYTVSASRDSAIWKTVCPVYPGQRLTLIGQDDMNATHAVPGWPFGLEGAILLVNDGPDAPVEVQVRPKGAFECSYDPANGYYTVQGRHGDGASARLFIKIARATPAQPAAVTPAQPVVPAQVRLVDAAPTQLRSAPAAQPLRSAPAAQPLRAAPAAAARPAPAKSPAVWKPREPALADDELTAVPGCQRLAPQAAEGDATYAPTARQRVSLAALALPRLSRYRDTGAQALEVGLNHALSPSALGTDAVISFAVDDADEVHAITADGRQRIDVPANFTPLDDTAVRLLAVAPPMAERYRALLCLPQGPGLPVAGGAPLVFGRSAPALAALRVLDSPRFLRHAEGAAEASADRLGLSRSAFSFEAVADGYRIARLAPAQALYHLDEQLGFVGAIGDATPERPYLLPPGHHLVAGHYVLRFDA